MGMYAVNKQQAERFVGPRVPEPFQGVTESALSQMAQAAGPMDFADDAQLDPSQVMFQNADMPESLGMGGYGAASQGGGSWLADVGWAPPVEAVGQFAGGLLGQLGFGGGGQMGVGAAPSAPTSGGGGGFRASPSGPDFRGPDFNPKNLVEWQGLVGVPQAIRTLRQAEKQLGLPGLSDAVTGVGFRTREQQQAAYNRYRAGQGALAAPPGSSFHEQGEAFDISADWLSANPTARPWLERHGFTWDVGGEPWHAHYVGGGAPLRPATGNQGRPIVTERSRRGRTSGNPLAAYRRR